MAEAEFDVFLSYNSKDRTLVKRLGTALKKRGLAVWLDVWQLRPGDDWVDALEDIISSCKSAAVCVGENGIGPWQDEEMKGLLIRFVRKKASGNAAPVIPVLLPKAPPGAEVPTFLEAKTWLDLRDGLLKKGLDQLEWGITGIDPATKSTVPPHTSLASEPEDRSELFKELTTYARRRIAKAATQWLKDECDPFVMPALSRRVQRPEAMTARQKVDPWEPLSDDQCRALVLGNLPQDRNRVRIFSQSGMGKTTLLHYCEQQIAESAEGKLPVRVSALSSYDWKGDVVKALVNRVLHIFLPRDVDEPTRVAWLTQLLHGKRVVFLFDAVDQTDDQLTGFAQFMQSIDVCECPVIVTGRPEVEQTRQAVFHEANWDTCRVEPFDEKRIREYLGKLSDSLMTIDDEVWRDQESFHRKQQWSDLLRVPLLLRLMRRLAACEGSSSSGLSLSTLRNRHAIYREAVRHLVGKGWQSLTHTSHQEDLLDHAEVNEKLSEMAWQMVSQGNFTSVLQGKPFRRWRSKHKDAIHALSQVDLTTRYSLLDNPGEFGLAWRHLSFCEYFAGLAFAELDRDEQQPVVRAHGGDPAWQWVFRFALAELAANDEQDACCDLAHSLVRVGNPFLVYDAIRDGVAVDHDLDTLCRWLVHRDWSPERDYTNAWDSDRQRPEANDDVLETLDALFDRRCRDSRYLHPAWELLTSSSDPRAIEIQRRFLAEFHELSQGSDAERAVADSLSLDEHFIQCPPPHEKRKTFKIGDNADRSVTVKPFYLGKAPITNQQFELFDPSHKHWRNQFSPDDDSPVLYVSWYMAVMFCVWLGDGCRLPSDDEWEVACRAGTTTKFWWGDEFDPAKCNSWESQMKRATAADPAQANAWGLMDMAGNVWEWCEDETRGGKGRVLRGGSWDYLADYCRCSSRDDDYYPNYRNYNRGFRLARTYP